MVSIPSPPRASKSLHLLVVKPEIPCTDSIAKVHRIPREWHKLINRIIIFVNVIE